MAPQTDRVLAKAAYDATWERRVARGEFGARPWEDLTEAERGPWFGLAEWIVEKALKAEDVTPAE